MNHINEVRLGTKYESDDVEKLAESIIDLANNDLDLHWKNSSKSLLMGLILHSLHKDKNGGSLSASLDNIYRLLTSSDFEVSDLWLEMGSYHHLNDMVHPLVANISKEMSNLPANECYAVLSVTTKSVSHIMASSS